MKFDRLSKKILCYMNEGERAYRLFDFGDDLEEMAKDLSCHVEKARANIRYLQEHGYITYNGTSGSARWFSLDHKGLHWKEFRRLERIDYLQEKWIDFLAMLFALMALALSIITSLQNWL